MSHSANKRTALVTGAARGIGHAVALELAKCCNNVILHARHKEQAQSTLTCLHTAGVNAEVWACDLSQAKIEPPAGINVLVHNASGFAEYSHLEEVPSSEIDNVLNVCLRSGMALAQAVLPSMRARKFGRLIFIGSAAGHLGASGQVAYATAKAGLVGLTRSLALEAGRDGITCNLVEPGLIETERACGTVPQDLRRKIETQTPLGRSGCASEVAALVSFLVGDQAAFITGASIPIDGGLGLGVAPLSTANENRR